MSGNIADLMQQGLSEEPGDLSERMTEVEAGINNAAHNILENIDSQMPYKFVRGVEIVEIEYIVKGLEGDELLLGGFAPEGRPDEKSLLAVVNGDLVLLTFKLNKDQDNSAETYFDEMLTGAQPFDVMFDIYPTRSDPEGCVLTLHNQSIGESPTISCTITKNVTEGDIRKAADAAANSYGKNAYDKSLERIRFVELNKKKELDDRQAELDTKNERLNHLKGLANLDLGIEQPQ